MNKVFWQTLIGFMVTTVLLAMFNSASLQTWSFDLEPGPMTDLISAKAEHWHTLMIDLGPAGMTEEIRFWFSDLTAAF